MVCQDGFEVLTYLSCFQTTLTILKGISPRIAKVSPACAIMITSYEYGKTFVSKEWSIQTLNSYFVSFTYF